MIWRREGMFGSLENRVDVCTSYYLPPLWLCLLYNVCCILCWSTTLFLGKKGKLGIWLSRAPNSLQLLWLQWLQKRKYFLRSFLLFFFLLLPIFFFPFGISEVLFYLFRYKWKHNKFCGSLWEQPSSHLGLLFKIWLTMKSYCRSHL